MGALGGPLSLPLGGEGLSGGRPWIVNLAPEPEVEQVKLLRPVRLSIRDAETYVDPAQLRIKVGYAKIHSNAEERFDTLPRTRRIALVAGVPTEPSITLVSGGVQISKTSPSAQRSVYTTAIEAKQGFPSAMVSAIVYPTVNTAPDSDEGGPLNMSISPGSVMPPPFSTLAVANSGGVVLGLEHGPRNKAVYIWLQLVTGGDPLVRLTGPVVLGGDVPFPNMTTSFDWSGPHRYTIVWSEADGYVEVYADGDGETTRLFRLPISSVSEMSSEYFARAGTNQDVVAIYGQEGVLGDTSVWSNIAVTTDVGYPILGNVRSGAFQTISQSADIIRIDGNKDPRDVDVGAWFDTPSNVLSDPDPLVEMGSVLGVFKMIKKTSGSTASIYRLEPGFLRTNTDGFMFQMRARAVNSQQDEASSGMGVVVYDGQTVYQVVLFSDFSSRTIGLQKKDGDPSNINAHFLPTTPLDWTVDSFRLCVEPRAGRIRMYAGADPSTPILDIPFEREALPSGEDRGWEALPPFVAFGHIINGSALGTFELTRFEMSHIYQSWEGTSGLAPNNIAVDPLFALTQAGSPTVGMVDQVLRVEAPSGALCKFHRPAPFNLNRGGSVEARLRITDFRPRRRTGNYLLLDDGLQAYALTFVDTSVGKFAALSLGSGSSFAEIVGRDGEAATLSFLVDWTVFHTYRIERKPYEGVRIFLDQETEPRIVYPEIKVPQLPQEQFSGSPTLAFGQFTVEGSTTEWAYVRAFFSGGYEISFKKNKPDSVLRTELLATQAIIVADARDV